MAETVLYDGDEYSLDLLSDKAKQLVAAIQHAEKQLEDKKNMLAVLTRAKKSYMDELKKEMLAQKAGFDFLE